VGSDRLRAPPAGRTVPVRLRRAIVDAFDDPKAEADLAVYRRTLGLPACTAANGCFRKVNQRGAARPLPIGDAGWGVEIPLNLQAASAACGAPCCWWRATTRWSRISPPQWIPEGDQLGVLTGRGRAPRRGSAAPHPGHRPGRRG
jgi:hypothetical protein